MQVQKTNIKSAVIREAKKQFLKNGFNNTNIREIASKAGVSIGNLYNYFPNKDALFHEVLRPVLREIEEAIRSYDEMDILGDEYLWSLEYHYEFIEKVALFLDKHRRELNLLLFKSQGSELEGFKEQFIEKYTGLMMRSITLYKEHYPDAIIPVSDFFIHTVTSLYTSVITELLMHNQSLEEMKNNLKELMTFMFYGWDYFIDRNKVFPKLKDGYILDR